MMSSGVGQLFNFENGFDGFWSAVVGGLISAIAVVAGVRLAQRFADRAREEEERQQAAIALVSEVSHLRDAAARSNRARRGDWSLWPLRTRLLMSQRLLGGTRGHRAAWELHDAAARFRSWIRHGPAATGDRRVSPRDEQRLREFQRELDRFADEVIVMLNGARPTDVDPIKPLESWPDLD